MRIALVELDSRTNVRRALASIRAKYRFTSVPLTAERANKRYLIVGVEKQNA